MRSFEGWFNQLFSELTCARITRNIGEYTDCWPWVREVLEDIKSGRNKSKPRRCVHQSSPELLCYPGLIPGCGFQTVCQLLKVRWASRTLDLGSWWAPLPKLLMRDRHSPIACVVSSPTQVKTWKIFLGWKEWHPRRRKVRGVVGCRGILSNLM